MFYDVRPCGLIKVPERKALTDAPDCKAVILIVPILRVHVARVEVQDESIRRTLLGRRPVDRLSIRGIGRPTGKARTAPIL
ncbi:MAG: hypothetical protein FWC94_05470 [Bacteroidales bacterium]|nr:hypothetical protein [Bacteroidales bacterium]